MNNERHANKIMIKNKKLEEVRRLTVQIAVLHNLISMLNGAEQIEPSVLGRCTDILDEERMRLVAERVAKRAELEK